MANNEGQVAVRFAVKDAEVVRQALLALGKDGEAALRRMDAAAKPVPKSLSAVSDVINELRQRGQGVAGSLGLVGTALLGLGPIGLAAGVALGGVVLAVVTLANKANELADKAGRIHDFAQSVGLTVPQVQALTIAGAEVGVSAEKIEMGFGRAVATMDQFRRAQGEAYDQVNRINPALAEQLVRARDTTQFVNLLAKAWEQAGASQRSALSRAVFGGRGGLEFGRLLDEVGKAGGIEKLEKSLAQSIVLTGEQARKFDELKDATDRLRTSAWDRIWALGAENALRQQKEVAVQLDWISRKLKDISEIDIKQSVLDLLFRSPDRSGGSLSDMGTSFDVPGAPRIVVNGRRDQPEGGGVPLPRPRPDIPAAAPAPLSAEAQFNRARSLFAVLGGAITPAEQLKLKILELNAAVASGSTTQAMANRALAEFRKKQDDVALATRERLGIASEEEIVSLRLRRLDDDRARGYIRNAAEMAIAAKLVKKEAEDQAKALEVRVSDFPNLTRLKQEAGNLTGQLDQELSGALRGVTSDLLDVAKGTTIAGDGLVKFTSKLVDAVGQAILMKNVVGPLAGALSNGLGGLLGGGAGVGGAAGGAGAVGNLVASAHGNVFDRGGLVPFRRGGVVDRPTFFRFGANRLGIAGEAGKEAIVPLHHDAHGNLGIRQSGGAGASIMINVQNNLGVAASAREERRPDGSIDLILDAVEARAADRVSRGRGPLAQAMPRNSSRLVG